MQANCLHNCPFYPLCENRGQYINIYNCTKQTFVSRRKYNIDVFFSKAQNRSNPADSYRFRVHTGKFILLTFKTLNDRSAVSQIGAFGWSVLFLGLEQV